MAKFGRARYEVGTARPADSVLQTPEERDGTNATGSERHATEAGRGIPTSAMDLLGGDKAGSKDNRGGNTGCGQHKPKRRSVYGMLDWTSHGRRLVVMDNSDRTVATGHGGKKQKGNTSDAGWRPPGPGLYSFSAGLDRSL